MDSRWPSGRSECDVIPSVVYQEHLIVPANGVTLLRISAENTIDYDWQENRLGVGTPSPVVHGGHVIGLKGSVLTCVNLGDRKILWKKRLKGRFWATPVAVGNYLYCFNRDGNAFVVDLTNKGEIVTEIEMGESISASPAVADDAMYVRSDTRLWKIADESNALAASQR